MEQKQFGYSLKDIPIAGNCVYEKCMLGKVESVIRRMRWKAKFYEADEAEEYDKYSSYGFKSVNTPPPTEQLNAFEETSTIWYEIYSSRSTETPSSNN